MTTHKNGWKHSLEWSNPRKATPNGLPRVLGVWTDRAPTTADFLAVYPDYKLGCGYAHSINFPPPKQRKKLSKEANALRNERRRKTLEANRIRKQLPLLAEVIIKDEGLDWRAES